MSPVLKVVLIAFLTNLPLGWMRGSVHPKLKILPKRSPEWWSAFRWTMLYIHLSIPIVAVARRHYGLMPWYVYVPILVAVALLAQALGEAFRKNRDAARPA